MRDELTEVSVKITRAWAMSNSETFKIPAIDRLLRAYVKPGMVVIDPFARGSHWGTITNDLNPKFKTTYNMDALEFLQSLPDNSADVALLDPPYSPRQVTEVYQSVGIKASKANTQSKFWARCKDEIKRIVKPGGLALSFCWNTTGIGKFRGFEIIEILIVSHGSFKNDTLCTVEIKSKP